MTDQSTEAKPEPRESWLSSNRHEKWADAMLRCRHPGAFCGADGFCHYEGDCFKRKRNPETRQALLERVERLEQELAEIRKALKDGADASTDSTVP